MSVNFIKKTFSQARHPQGNLFYNVFNFFYYIYKRNNWMLDFSRFWKDFEDVKIDRPVFLLGFHGGGTTLISRMIRRNEDFVSVSGNYRYWAGADEMQVVLGQMLPPELAGIRHKIPSTTKLKAPTHWLYATDKYLSYFRNTKQDVTPELRDKVTKIIKWNIYRQAVDKNKARFVDKSQIYTIKVSFLNEILKDSNPKFVLVLRNPYVLCCRIVDREANSFRNNNIESRRKQLEFASQHWVNSVRCALKDSEEADLMLVRVEDVLNQPEKCIKKITDFIETEFSNDMLPHREHKIPFGSLGRNKWYPLRSDVNEKYFAKMDKEDIEIIANNVEEYADKFGYSKPK